ncbi:MAG: hypothetical protein XD98_0340 [Microgenomates bacterium 39_6]|nr:MAG: hypothetical protein XD98_0340 [Microgenomates bacterium 39_6]
MFKKIFFTNLVGFIFLGFLAKPQEAIAAGAQEAGASAQAVFLEDKLEKSPDLRLAKLEDFLVAKASPLADYAVDFIFFADQFNIDWRLLPAIAGIESGFGKVIPAGSYNAYGWGNGKIYFSSWPESIEVVSRALSKKYYQKGLDTPEKIGPVYAPPSPDWASKIRAIMNQIDQIEFSPEPKF